MAMGSVELDGRVRVETPMNDPVFDRPCCYFRVVVKERRGSGRNSHWETVFERDSSGTTFLLEDSTGLARVSPVKAELQFSPEVDTTSNGLTRGFRDDAVSKFLATLGSSWNTRRITAHILREGQPLFLVGYVAPAESAPANVAMSVRDVARELKANPEEMKKLDENHDGVVDAQEWEAGVARKTRELADASGAAALARPAEAVMTVRCSPDGIFVMADSEKALVSRLDWTAWLGILGGPAVAIASVVYLVSQFRSLAPGIRHLTGSDIPSF